jgi:hypothetical protein
MSITVSKVNLNVFNHKIAKVYLSGLDSGKTYFINTDYNKQVSGSPTTDFEVETTSSISFGTTISISGTNILIGGTSYPFALKSTDDSIPSASTTNTSETITPPTSLVVTTIVGFNLITQSLNSSSTINTVTIGQLDLIGDLPATPSTTVNPIHISNFSPPATGAITQSSDTKALIANLNVDGSMVHLGESITISITYNNGTTSFTQMETGTVPAGTNVLTSSSTTPGSGNSYTQVIGTTCIITLNWTISKTNYSITSTGIGSVVNNATNTAYSNPFTLSNATTTTIKATSSAVGTQVITLTDVGTVTITWTYSIDDAAAEAANAAAEAASAATAAAQAAVDAVATLSTQVAELMKSVQAKITALTALVAKIKKKIQA